MIKVIVEYHTVILDNPSFDLMALLHDYLREGWRIESAELEGGEKLRVSLSRFLGR